MPFPELPEYPTNVGEILVPVTETGRPLVWDEDGVPLNSDVVQSGLRPNRDVRDYAEAPHLVTWPESKGPKWSNTALMRHMEPAVPDMVAITLETTRGFREMLGKNDGFFSYDEAFVAVSGLQKAWSLLMYGPNRLPNGQLPRHIASLQRVLLGHAGAILYQMAESPAHILAGMIKEGDIEPQAFADFIFSPDSEFLTNTDTHEICPASKAAHIALIDCLFAPADEATAKHGERWLEKADPSRNLASYSLEPAKIVVLGLEAAAVMLDAVHKSNGHDLLLTHRYLVGDTSPEVELHMLRQAELDA